MALILVNKNDVLYIKGNEIPFTGIHIRHFSEGKLREKGHYLNGRKHGRWEYYTPDMVGLPQLRSVMHFKLGKRNGVSEHYYTDGTISAYQYWKDDKYVPESEL